MLVAPMSEFVINNSNVPEVDSLYDEYVPGETYNIGNKVQYNYKIYKCLADGTTGIAPDSDILKWEDTKEVVNYLKMFDSTFTSSTTNTDTIQYEITADDIDVIAFFGLTSKTVTVEVKDSLDNTVYTRTIDTFDREVSDWVSWTVASPEYMTTAFFRDIPFFYQSKIFITIDNTGEIAECSHCVIGQSKNMGITLVNPNPISSIRNIISKEKQADGTVKTENSMTYRRIVANVLVDTKKVNDVQQFLEKYTVTPLLFMADEREGGIDVLMTFGIYKDFDMPIGLTKTQYQIEIEGVV